MTQQTRFWLAGTLYLVVVLGLGVALARATTGDSRAELQYVVNGATVDFAVSDTRLPHPWACTDVTWSVERIEAVFFDDQPGVGQQTTTYCPATANNDAPLLYVDFRGNFIQEYSIPVVVLTSTAPFRGTVLFALVGALALVAVRLLPAGTPNPSARMSRRGFIGSLAGVGALVALGTVGTLLAVRRPVQVVTTDDGWVVRSTEQR